MALIRDASDRKAAVDAYRCFSPPVDDLSAYADFGRTPEGVPVSSFIATGRGGTPPGPSSQGAGRQCPIPAHQRLRMDRRRKRPCLRRGDEISEGRRCRHHRHQEPVLIDGNDPDAFASLAIKQCEFIDERGLPRAVPGAAAVSRPGGGRPPARRHGGRARRRRTAARNPPRETRA